MNRAALNTVVLNAESLNAFQRVQIALSAAASIVFGSPMVVRGPVTVVCQAAAQVVITGMEAVFAAVAAIARAVVSVTGTSFPVNPVSVPVAATARAIVAATGLVESHTPVAVSARADLTITESSFSYVLGMAAVSAVADVGIDFETYKRLPFDENATEERTMLVPEQDRRMVVV